MYRRVAAVPDQATAGLLQSFLEVSGIDVLEFQITPHASLAGCDTGYFVEVEEKDHDRAVTLLVDEGYGKWVITPGSDQTT